MNKFQEEIGEVVDNFGRNLDILKDIDVDKLPVQLQFKLAMEMAKLTAAMKRYNTETAKIIVIASMLDK